MILSRYLTKNDYGTYRQTWLIYNTLLPLFLLGLPLSVNYFVPGRHVSEQKSFNIQTYLILTLSGLIFSLAIFVSAPAISSLFHNKLLVEFIRIFSCIPLLALPGMYYQELLICLNRPRLAALISSLLSIFQFSAIVVPIMLGLGLTAIFNSLIFFFILRLLIVSYVIFRPFLSKVSKRQGFSIIDQLKYSIPIALSAIMGSLTIQVDKLNIASMFSTTEFAIYSNGAFQIPLIGIITGSVTAVLMPEFVKLNQNNELKLLISTWHSAIRKVALIIIPIMFFLLIFSAEFITLLFSQDYIDSAGIFRIYLLTLPARITNFGMILLAMGLSSIVFKYSVLTLALNLILNYILIKVIGFSGPAIATVVAVYMIVYLQLWKISDKFELSIKKIFPWKNLIHITFLSAILGGLLLIVKLYFFKDINLKGLLIYALFYLIFFITGGLSTKLLTDEDVKIPLRFLKQLFQI